MNRQKRGDLRVLSASILVLLIAHGLLAFVVTGPDRNPALNWLSVGTFVGLSTSVIALLAVLRRPDPTDSDQRRYSKADDSRCVEQRLRLFFEHVPAGVAMFDREMRYLHFSRRWMSDHELGDADPTGLSHYQVMPGIPDHWKEVHRRCLAGAIERSDEDTYRTPDGREKWHRWETRPWFDDQGAVGGIIIFSENITEEVRNRRVIQEHAETLAGILEASVDHLYVIDRQGIYQHVSAGGARIIGYDTADVLGKHWTELGLSADVMTTFDAQRDEVLRTGLPSKQKSSFVARDGQTHYYEYTIAPIVREGCSSDAVVVVSRDITAHVIDERDRLALLKESERQNAFIHAVLNQVPAAIVVADAQSGQLLLSNQESHRIVRHPYEAGRLLNEYGDQFIQAGIRPDGSQYQYGEWPLERALQGETVVGEEIELFLRGDQRVAIRVNAGPIHVGDELVAAVVAFHDITARKQAEQTSRFLADASASLADLVDYSGTLKKVVSLAVPTFADWAAVDMLDESDSIIRQAFSHSDPAKAELVLEYSRRYPPGPTSSRGVRSVIRTGRSMFLDQVTDELLETLLFEPERRRFLAEIGLKSYICVPLTIRGETFGALSFASAGSGRIYNEQDLAVAEDLASRAAIAIDNARLYGELKQADRSKNQFLATLAHELRNPLAPILNTLRLFRTLSDVDGFELERAMAERQVVHLTRLIDDLMDVARITRGKIELQKSVVELANVIRQAVETALPRIEERHHRLTIRLPELPIFVEADPTRLEQVLWNLLNNAAKYTEPAGEITLEVDSEEGQVRVKVSDSGIGIRPEMLPKIFQMFVQVEDHSEHFQGGLGIGLSLVKTLVELHGGSISAQSDGPGRGSEFVVRLPVLDRAVAIAPKRLDSPRATDDSSIPRKILVVDDNIDAARTLGRLLNRLHGHEIRLAHDGPEALSVANDFRPEVILLDIGLPGMDGTEVARRLRDQPEFETLLIVALTGWGQDEDRRRSKQAGIDHHLVKPVDPDALMSLLGNTQPAPA